MQGKLFEQTFVKALATIRNLLPSSCFSTQKVLQNPFGDSPKREELTIQCCILDTSVYILITDIYQTLSVKYKNMVDQSVSSNLDSIR